LQLDIQLHHLACGMPLLMMPNRDVAVATADVWVHTGASDEPEEVAGVSHFLEHMLFKGTEKWGVGEIERAIEAVGGVCNAGTSFDFTHYYVTLPSSGIDQAIGMLVGMMRSATLDGGELDRERQVILEEYRRKQDNPQGLLWERLYEEMFAAGRYRRSVIGSEATIKAIDRERMMAYYRRRYGPENLALVVTGEIDPARVIETAERETAGFNAPVEAHADEPTQFAGGKRLHLNKPTGGEIYVAFAFPAPGWNRPAKVMALDLAQCLLGEGRAARLYQSLKEERGLCSSIGVGFPTHQTDSLAAVCATCRPDQLDALRDGVIEELRRFVAATPEAADDARARRLLASAHRFSLETCGGLASQIGYAWTVGGDLRHLEQYLEELDATTAEQARAAAAECFGNGEMAERMVEIAVGPGMADAVAPEEGL
jgi:predicted Zn-dependent peptidase